MLQTLPIIHPYGTVGELPWQGDDAIALATVDEAIKVATERHARIPECLARIVRTNLLLRSATSDQKAEGGQELERARALLRENRGQAFRELHQRHRC